MEETFLDKAKKHLKKYGKYYAGAAALAGTAYGAYKYGQSSTEQGDTVIPKLDPKKGHIINGKSIDYRNKGATIKPVLTKNDTQKINASNFGPIKDKVTPTKLKNVPVKKEQVINKPPKIKEPKLPDIKIKKPTIKTKSLDQMNKSEYNKYLSKSLKDSVKEADINLKRQLIKHGEILDKGLPSWKANARKAGTTSNSLMKVDDKEYYSDKMYADFGGEKTDLPLGVGLVGDKKDK